MPATPKPDVRDVTGGWERVFPAYAPEQLFALISDIETYPRFMPGCVATRVLERQGAWVWRVDNVFGFGPVRCRFTSRAALHPPERLEIVSYDGPWRRFEMAWRLISEHAGCRVCCEFSSEMHSPVMAALVRAGLPEIERRIVAAFEKRARALYG